MIRMGLGIVEAASLADHLLTVGEPENEQLLDQLFLLTILIAHRRRIRIGSRDEYETRCNRILARLDPAVVA